MKGMLKFSLKCIESGSIKLIMNFGLIYFFNNVFILQHFLQAFPYQMLHIFFIFIPIPNTDKALNPQWSYRLSQNAPDPCRS